MATMKSQTKLIDTLGPEPLSADFNAEYLSQKLKSKQVGVKVAIMDNHVVVGVGNVCATESLFNSVPSPLRKWRLV